MLRQLHSVLGVSAGLLVGLLVITGVALSIYPVVERLEATVVGTSQITVAELVSKVMEQQPGIEELQRTPAGKVVVFYTEDNKMGSATIHPITALPVAEHKSSPFKSWLKKLHRSYLVDTPGRIVTAVGALVMLVLAQTGLFLLAKRAGGWRDIWRRPQGDFQQRLHIRTALIAVLGLTLSASTGLYMFAETFSLLPSKDSPDPMPPSYVSSGVTTDIASFPALKEMPLSDLRELVFPQPYTENNVYFIRTRHGAGVIAADSGEILIFEPYGGWQKAFEFIYMLHTGEGVWWLALLLGVSSLAMPLLFYTGVIIWWRRRRGVVRIKDNINHQLADTIVLVGSENNTTWGFANTLHNALTTANHRVHTGAMNSLTHYPNAKRLYVLASTYGNGEAPSSAKLFFKQLANLDSSTSVPYAVLGFGDRQFPQYCAYAKSVAAALQQKGWSELLPPAFIDRQSSQQFGQWGQAVGKQLNEQIELNYTPKLPTTVKMQLSSRTDYGNEVGAPTATLIFKTNMKLQNFEAGDLLAVLAPGINIPRYYSLVSSRSEGIIEICVRKHLGGVCSQFLYDLKIGDSINAFFQSNTKLRLAESTTPVILIGAGTGIGPLVGLIRNNRRRPIYLYWGGRDPASDFLYEQELKQHLSDGKLTQLNAIFSRVKINRGYVQDKLLNDQAQVASLIQAGAYVLVCGGRNMATDVVTVLEKIIEPTGMNVTGLKTQERYREDIY